MKTKLVYSPGGIAIADHKAEETAQALKMMNFSVSTDNVIYAYRCLLKEGFFTPDEVEVLFERIKHRLYRRT